LPTIDDLGRAGVPPRIPQRMALVSNSGAGGLAQNQLCYSKPLAQGTSRIFRICEALCALGTFPQRIQLILRRSPSWHAGCCPLTTAHSGFVHLGPDHQPEKGGHDERNSLACTATSRRNSRRMGRLCGRDMHHQLQPDPDGGSRARNTTAPWLWPCRARWRGLETTLPEPEKVGTRAKDFPRAPTLHTRSWDSGRVRSSAGRPQPTLVPVRAVELDLLPPPRSGPRRQPREPLQNRHAARPAHPCQPRRDAFRGSADQKGRTTAFAHSRRSGPAPRLLSLLCKDF
jgi:hypothetical protein